MGPNTVPAVVEPILPPPSGMIMVAGKEKSTSPELDFLPIRGGASKSSSASTGKKGKLNKQGKGSAGPPG